MALISAAPGRTWLEKKEQVPEQYLEESSLWKHAALLIFSNPTGGTSSDYVSSIAAWHLQEAALISEFHWNWLYELLHLAWKDRSYHLYAEWRTDKEKARRRTDKKQVRYLINHLRVQRLPKLFLSRVIVATIRSRSCWLQWLRTRRNSRCPCLLSKRSQA